MATALEEMRGGSVDATIASGDYRCRLDSGPGGCRLYVVRPQTAGCTFTLPNPAYIRAGAEANFVVINKGPNSISIRSNGATPIYTLATDRAVEVRIIAQGVDLWALSGPYVVSSGTALNGDRKPFEIAYTASNASAQTRVRNDIAQQYGYVGADGPAAVMVTIKANVVLGGGTATTASFDTGGWPAGTTMTIMMESGSYIAGRGGNGGAGQNAQTLGAGTPASGGNGGPAMYVRCNSALISMGTIGGGGGGGYGGLARPTSSPSYAGGGGGGGAGVPGGIGANGGLNMAGQQTANTRGQDGTLTAGGLGGAAESGNTSAGGPGRFGGGLGASGQAGGFGTSGSAGPAIQTLTGFTLTKITAGTILGAEVTV